MMLLSRRLSRLVGRHSHRLVPTQRLLWRPLLSSSSSFSSKSVHSVIPEVDKSYVRSVVDGRSDVVVIDVRRDSELEHGTIPSSRHVPLDEIDEALAMDAEAFKSKYGFEKPSEEDDIVFYCLGGVRSEAATALALSKGFVNAKNYRGSFIDWFGRSY
eukprot:TRINITY_DN94083_c0_g1_i1.p1 TRINITY_DN94083_c0_g1~~TRINITY_DN94083_c0_g1_i1.p1  ORF type:complete len:158 (+),score=61.82 TRINITY_DN94083_c0_g1_i1:38-511(+)